MERLEDTVEVDTIRYRHNEWDADLIRDGREVYTAKIYVQGYSFEIDGPVEIEFDEYYTDVRGDMVATVSYVEREHEGETYYEDHILEDVEVQE